MFRFSTEQEAKAFLLGILIGYTQKDFGLS